MNKKTLTLTLIVLLLVTLVVIIVNRNDKNLKDDSSEKLKVVTTLFPLYDIAKNIGGESAEVSLLLDPGIEAHSFEPTPSDMVKISQADIFIYTGEFMETWAEDVLRAIKNPKLLVIDTSHSVNFIEDEDHHDDHDEDEHHHDDHDEDEHHHEGVDPHIWLDFDNLKAMVNNINDGLKEKMPIKQEEFEFRAANYIDRLTILDGLYRQGLANCEQKSIIYSGHYAFAYLAHRYNLGYSSAYGLSPNAEPSAATLVSLAKQLKSSNASYIFHEELLSPRIAETLERETGVKLLSLNTAHNLSRQDLDDGKTLFTVFEDNLNNLKLGLNCR
jgi:zinc transport system substrate-binding protein